MKVTEDLQKALEQLKPKLTRVTMTGSYQEGYLDAVHDAKSLLAQVFSEKVIAEEKNVEYAKLVAAQAEEHAEKLRDKVLVDRKQLSDKARTFPEMVEENSQCCKGFIKNCCDCKEKCGKEEWVSIKEIQPRLMKLVQERDDNKLLVVQAVTKLRAKEEQLEGKVLLDRKQLSELLEDTHIMAYPRLMEFLRESLEGSAPLSPEEIKDVEASEKEFAEGKGKVFENAEDLIADLHKGRKKGSVKEGSK